MSAPLEQSRIDVLQAAAAALSATTTKGRGKARTAPRPTPDSFLKAYYHLVATEELIARDPAELAATALSHREFAQSRPVGTSNIRVANLDVGANGKEATYTSVDIVVDDMPFLVDSVVSALGGFDRGVRSIVQGFVSLEIAGGFKMPVLLDDSFHWLINLLIAGLEPSAEGA